MKLKIDNAGNVTLTDRDYVAAGGEAAVYRHGSQAIKIYHDPAKMIPVPKIQELSVIPPDNVLKPQAIVRDVKDKPVGYTMKFVDGTLPMVKLFTKSFRADHNVSNQQIADLVKVMQQTIAEIHRAKVLIVDGNEMNYLVDDKFTIPYFIDVDSWQTAHYRATALMESVRDRQVKNNQFTEGSDWFAFAIVAFQLYVGIHPYKGSHPNYKPKDWSQRMDDGISVFEPGVKLPPTVSDFSVIPPRHLDWFKEVFVKNQRNIPPLPDGIIAAVVQQITKVIKSVGSFNVEELYEFDAAIRAVQQIGNTLYFLGHGELFKSGSARSILDFAQAKRVMLSQTTTGTPLFATYRDQTLTVGRIGNAELQITNVSAVMQRNNIIYTIVGDKLFENDFIQRPDGSLMQTIRIAGNVLPNSGAVFAGVVYQDVLGKPWLMIPFDKGKLFMRHIPELDGYRVIDAYSERNVTVVIGERHGQFDRFVFWFDMNFAAYHCRKTEDVDNNGINMTTLPSGVCVLVTGDDEVEIFRGQKVSVTTGTPFDSSMRLFERDGVVHFIDGKKVYKVSMNK